MTPPLPEGFTTKDGNETDRRTLPPLTGDTHIRIHRDGTDTITTARNAIHLIAEGKLDPNDWAYRTGYPDWILLSALLAELPKPPLTAPPKPPPLPDATPITCVKCGSTQLTTHKTAFNVGAALLGFACGIPLSLVMAAVAYVFITPLLAIPCLFFSPLGLLAGFQWASLNTTCLRCGHTVSRKV